MIYVDHDRYSVLLYKVCKLLPFFPVSFQGSTFTTFEGHLSNLKLEAIFNKKLLSTFVLLQGLSYREQSNHRNYCTFDESVDGLS